MSLSWREIIVNELQGTFLVLQNGCGVERGTE
jgi:hypothetical protein